MFALGGSQHHVPLSTVVVGREAEEGVSPPRVFHWCEWMCWSLIHAVCILYINCKEAEVIGGRRRGNNTAGWLSCSQEKKQNICNQELIACSLNWPHIVQPNLSVCGSFCKDAEEFHFGMEMKQNYSERGRHSSPRAGFGQRGRDRGEASKQFNPSPISCESLLILMRRCRPAVQYTSLNPHYSTA